jgi:hypothetical protein
MEGKQVALDIDETLLNSVEKHVRVLNLVGQALGWKNLPTYDQVIALGGTHKAYGDYPGYRELNKQMMKGRWFNDSLQIIEGALEAMGFLEAQIAIYLTTRPKQLAKFTREQLKKLGFPDRDVIARPSSVKVENTSQWKMDVLKDLSGKHNAPVVMIDDSISLHHVIKDSNHPGVKTVLYAGPMTPRGNGEVTWPEVPDAVQKA